MFQPLDRGKFSDGDKLSNGGRSSYGGSPSDRDKLSDRGQPCPYARVSKDDELLRYALEGSSLSYPMEEHINQCKICRQQVESLMSTNSSLVRKLYRSRCPD